MKRLYYLCIKNFSSLTFYYPKKNNFNLIHIPEHYKCTYGRVSRMLFRICNNKKKLCFFLFAHLFNKSIFIIMWTMQPQNFGYIDNMCPTNVVCVFFFYSFFFCLWSAFNINLSSFNCRIINKINSNDLGRCDLLFISMVFVYIRFSLNFLFF